MGVDVEIYLADWPKLGRGILAALNKGLGGYIPTQSHERLSGADMLVDMWNWKGLCEEFSFARTGVPTRGSWYYGFRGIWSNVIASLEGEKSDDGREISVPPRVELIDAANTFIGGLVGGDIIEVNPHKLKRWHRYTEIINVIPGCHSCPAEVSVLARAWRQLSGRTGELRPYIEPLLSGQHRFGDFEDFERYLLTWGELIEKADSRQWGVVVIFS